jgi:hypothetical protein
MKFEEIYCNQINIEFQYIILQLKHYISKRFRSFIGNPHGDHTSIICLLVMIYETSDRCNVSILKVHFGIVYLIGYNKIVYRIV